MREQIMRVKNSESVPVLLVGNKVSLWVIDDDVSSAVMLGQPTLTLPLNWKSPLANWHHLNHPIRVTFLFLQRLSTSGTPNSATDSFLRKRKSTPNQSRRLTTMWIFFIHSSFPDFKNNSWSSWKVFFSFSPAVALAGVSHERRGPITNAVDSNSDRENLFLRNRP